MPCKTNSNLFSVTELCSTSIPLPGVSGIMLWRVAGDEILSNVKILGVRQFVAVCWVILFNSMFLPGVSGIMLSFASLFKALAGIRGKEMLYFNFQFYILFQIYHSTFIFIKHNRFRSFIIR